MLFSGEIRARGCKDADGKSTLMSEAGNTNTKGPQISAKFKMEPNTKGKNPEGREVSVAGEELFWYATVTGNTRERIIDSLVHSGLKKAVARQFVENTENGEYGRVPAAAGFGSKVCSLTVSIDEYKDKKKSKIEWVNGPEGGRANKAAAAPEMKLDLDAADDDEDGDDAGSGDDDAPWQR